MIKLSISQQGVALITALLVVALATIAAVAMTTRQQIDIYRTANIINSEQAYLYALGGESWVKRILLRDNNATDSLQDEWAIPLPPLYIPGGAIQGYVEDLQGRFNLNNLVKDGKASPEDIIFFERLLRLLELPPELAQGVVDWIDSDMEPQQSDGAEDNAYLGKTPAYRTSNTLFSSPTELRLLAGFNKKDSYQEYQKLLPYVSTLPIRTPININTAPLPILMALVEGLNEMDVSALITEREKKIFESPNDFIVHDALAGLTIDKNLNISVFSAYFLFKAEVQIDRGRALLNSTLHRLPDQVTVVARSR
jgi:general secretion pathway protein K